MSWKLSSYLERFKRSKSNPSNYLDKKLRNRVKLEKLPNSTQFKYLANFLSSAEKRTLIGATTLLAVTLISWGIYFISTHSILTPKNGGEYSEGLIGSPKYINPIFASTNDIDTDISSLIYSGLFKYDSNKQLVPDLAEKFVVGTDQKTYDIQLKAGLKWSDGEPLTTDDILFTFETLQNAEVGSPLIVAFQGVQISKLSDNTIRFTLKTPYAPFLDSLTLGILPEHVWAEISPANMRLAQFNLQPLGSGPWKFLKMVKDSGGNIQSYTLSPNTNYYGQKPFLNNVTFKFFDNYNDAISALRSQNILGLSFVPHNLKDKVNGKSLNNFGLQLPQYTAIFFNQTTSELKDDNFRLALAQAIDKKTVIDQALNGDGMAIDAPILPGNLGYFDSVKKIPFDLNAANVILDKKWPRIQPEEYFKIRYSQITKSLVPAASTSTTATTKTASDTAVTLSPTDQNNINETIRGEMNSGQSFYRQNGKNDALRLSITTADTPEYIKTAQQIAQMWRALGIQTNVVSVNSHQIVRDVLKDRSYQILIYGEMIGADPDLYSFWHSTQSDYPGLNLARFSNRDADKLLESARTTLETDSRAKLYQKFQGILADQLPAIFLYSPTYIMAVNKDIQGVETGNIVSPQDRLDNLNYWYIKTTRQIKF
ncbi:MAG: peptide ABC transporter substrate-binding protein [Candidatus Magasanikbacteria bacterium]|nr:peptide ABC transporter substrate-binding protein [Candidatus Magasanikbacteria bacterium]